MDKTQLVAQVIVSRSKEQAFSHELPEGWEGGAVFIIPKCLQDTTDLPALAAVTGHKSEWQLVLRSQMILSGLKTRRFHGVLDHAETTSKEANQAVRTLGTNALLSVRPVVSSDIWHHTSTG